MKLTLVAPALAATSLAISSAAMAGVVASESFESPVLNNGAIQYSVDEFVYNTNAVGPVSVPNVTFSGFSGVTRNNDGYVAPTPFGSQEAFLQSFPSAGAQVSWSVSGLTPGQSYALSFYDIAFGVGAQTLGVSAFGASGTYTPASQFVYGDNILNFTATSSSGTVDFQALTSGGNFVTGIDNLTISTVPEPAGWAMMLLGLGGLGAVIRRQRRNGAIAAA